MKYLKFTILAILISNSICAQNNINTREAKVIHDTYDNLKDLKQKKEDLGIGPLTYYDSTFKFKVLIPEWFEVIESDNPYVFSGILPKVEGIANAIAIKSFDKGKKTFEEFEEYIVKHMVFGQPVKWSKTQKSMGKKALEEYNNLGKSYKVYLMMNKLMYHCQYVLVETKTAFVWIDFTATQETFEKNKPKFDEFMKGFEIVK